MYNSFQYIISNDGIDTENCYPFGEYVSLSNDYHIS